MRFLLPVLRLSLRLSLLLLLRPSAAASATTLECSAEGDCQRQQEADRVDYLIVGAGGSGIQTALLLQKYGYSCQILEKELSAGYFWTQFPVFRELISVNKLSRNWTQQFRFDWHSMLETPILMWNISQEYYPSGQDWHKYMARVVQEAGIDIKFGVEVMRLATDNPCVILADNSQRCAKYRVFVGTGLKEKDEPYLRAIGGTPYSQITREQARGKVVCIAGNGNAGFEVAQNLFPIADRVFIYGKRPPRLSSVTKYTGDVRVKFLTVLENFHGKLLDSVLQMGDYMQIRPLLEDDADLLNATQFEQVAILLNFIVLVNFHRCEILVLATGFRSTVPGMHLKRRFPQSSDWYASKDNPAVHYVGWLMHQRDLRRGAGGFLAGYRYLIRNLVHHVREEDHKVPYPFLKFTKQQALDHAANRFQTADDLVILQDGVTLRDAIVPVTKKNNKVEYHYYEGITYKFHRDLLKGRDDVIYLYFGWGDGRSAASVFDNVYLFEGTTDLINIYLHPVVEVNGLVREAEEDLDMIWNTGQFIPPIKRIVRDAIRKDYTKFYPKPKYPYERAEVKRPRSRQPHEKGEHAGVGFRSQITEKTVQAVLKDGTMESLRALSAAARKNMPSLLFPTKKKTIFNSSST